MNNLTDLGRAVAQLRVERGVTQGDLATQAGVAKSSLSRFEAGSAGEFGSRKLLRVLEVLGMEVRLVAADTDQTFNLDDALAARSAELNTALVARRRVRRPKGAV
jgi:transcriptional regulator with XRE-family HTH domain